MNQAAASPSASTHDPAPAEVVLPNLRWALFEAVLAVALGTAFFLIPADWIVLHGAGRRGRHRIALRTLRHVDVPLRDPERPAHRDRNAPHLPVG